MAIHSNRKLWEMGARLNDAWLEFADPEAKRRHSELPTLATFAAQAKAANAQTGIELLKLYGAGARQWQDRVEFENQLREALLIELSNEQLHAYAYRVAPSQSRLPVLIAADLFDLHDPDWQRESLSARGIEYAEIRIVDPKRFLNLPKPRTGRKGSAIAIRKAIADLQNEGVDLCGPRKLACDLIRRRINTKYVNGSGLSDSNLVKYIQEICPPRAIN